MTGERLGETPFDADRKRMATLHRIDGKLFALVKLLLAAVIIYTPLGNSLFACSPIGVNVWLLLIPFAIMLLATDETRKYFVRRSAPAAPGVP